jgi:H+-transporting ATPase
VRQADGSVIRVLKGAFAVIAGMCQSSTEATSRIDELQAKGFRVLAVAAGPPDCLKLAGLIALSDPPRADSANLVAELKGLGVRTIMVTGDARVTAKVVAGMVGIEGRVWAATPLPDDLRADDFSIFAGVLPEDKYRLVKALQTNGHLVGMCGDGANDAPALRQAQMGIAVFTATDVAKSAAGIVLTEPGLGGIVMSVKEGRRTFQRILTYTLRSIVHKVVQVLFLTAGLLMMVTGDFLAMSSSTDNVRPSPKPNRWRIRNLTTAGVIMCVVDLMFCVACLATGKYVIGLNTESLRTLTVITMVFSGQALFYVAREREHLWSSLPGRWLVMSSIIDIAIISLLATNGFLMAAIPIGILVRVFGAAVIFAFVPDAVKSILFDRLAVV